MLNSPINTNEWTTLLFAFGDTIAEGSQVLKDSPPGSALQLGPSPVIGAENVMMMYIRKLLQAVQIRAVLVTRTVMDVQNGVGLVTRE